MDEKNAEHYQSIYYKIKFFFSNDKTRKHFFRAAKIFLSIAMVIGGIAFRNVLNPLTIYTTFFTEPNITYNFAKYNVEGADIYYGELINDSSTHAKEVILKGKFNSEVIACDIITCDSIEKEENNPVGSIEFFLKRLSRGSSCSFSIIVHQDAKILEQFKISWGDRGILLIDLQKSDKNVEKGIELSDLSRKARQTWLENNTRNIRK
ncbi:MAG: hypothetical protein WA240_05590 [Nitrospirota bacterium]